MRRLILGFVMSLGALPALAQDCGELTSNVAMGQCQAKAYDAADAQLNAVYRQVTAYVKGIDADLPKSEQGAAQSLKLAQRAWITVRDETCNIVSVMWSGGSGRGMAVATCLTDMTTARTAELQALLGE